MNNQDERMGGSYAINDEGLRVLVHRTQESPPGEPAPPVEETPAVAGFFSPKASRKPVPQPAAPDVPTVADPITEKE